MVANRKTRSLAAAVVGLFGVSGLIAISWGINVITSTAGKVPALGWVLLVYGVLVCTGGVLPLAWMFFRDMRAKITLDIREARLTMTETAPGLTRWVFAVDVTMTPPLGHAVTIQSEGISVKLENPWAPLIIGYMAIGPAYNADLMSSTLTIGKRTNVVCEGATNLNIDPDIALDTPDHFPVELTISDASGDWTATTNSVIVRTGDNEWQCQVPQTAPVVAASGRAIRTSVPPKRRVA